LIRAVADTHALIWYAYADARLSLTALATFESAAAEGEQIGFSAISLVEMVYLVEKGRIRVEALDQLLAAIDNPDSVLIELPVDRAVAAAMQQVSRDQVPDMPDRIIASTALIHKVPVISRDSRIRLSEVQTIW
jgi:PIN domain nuclease of toxin-antitoxin system